MTSETTTPDGLEHQLKLRGLELDDYADIKNIMDRVYPGMGGGWPERKFRAMLKVFKEGQICIADNGKVVAAAFAVVVDYDKFGDNHTYDEITGDAYLTTHDPNGDVLYGDDVFVDPEYRDMRLGRRLYEARKELCTNLNLRAIVAGATVFLGCPSSEASTFPRVFWLLYRGNELRGSHRRLLGKSRGQWATADAVVCSTVLVRDSMPNTRVLAPQHGDFLDK